MPRRRRRATVNSDPFVLFHHQNTPFDCLPACVKMVIDGLAPSRLSVRQIKEALQTDEAGTDMVTPQGFTIKERLDNLISNHRLPIRAFEQITGGIDINRLEVLPRSGRYPIASLLVNTGGDRIKVLCTYDTGDLYHEIVIIKVDREVNLIYALDPNCSQRDGLDSLTKYSYKNLPSTTIEIPQFIRYWRAAERRTIYFEPKETFKAMGQSTLQVTDEGR